MIEFFLKNINPIKILVLISFLFGLFFLNKSSSKHRLLLMILLLSVITEYGVLIFIYFKKPYDFFYSISFIIHNILWLNVIDKVYKKLKYSEYIKLFYLAFSIVNLIFFEGIQKINCITFILGAFIYLISFIYLSYILLKNEKIAFLISNDYLLLFLPIIFFIGFSLMFGFDSYSLFNQEIFSNYKLYNFIGDFSCLNYYLLIILYIYRVRKTIKNE